MFSSSLEFVKFKTGVDVLKAIPVGTSFGFPRDNLGIPLL
jgi:hypothetical protein